jgi:hypothetical protein
MPLLRRVNLIVGKAPPPGLVVCQKFFTSKIMGRNMTEADLLRCIEAVDRRRELCRSEYGRFKAVPPIAGTGGRSASAKATAMIVGTSYKKIERARRVLPDPKEKAEVMAGKYSPAQTVGSRRGKGVGALSGSLGTTTGRLLVVFP